MRSHSKRLLLLSTLALLLTVSLAARAMRSTKLVPLPQACPEQVHTANDRFGRNLIPRWEIEEAYLEALKWLRSHHGEHARLLPPVHGFQLERGARSQGTYKGGGEHRDDAFKIYARGVSVLFTEFYVDKESMPGGRRLVVSSEPPFQAFYTDNHYDSFCALRSEAEIHSHRDAKATSGRVEFVTP